MPAPAARAVRRRIGVVHAVAHRWDRVDELEDRAQVVVGELRNSNQSMARVSGRIPATRPVRIVRMKIASSKYGMPEGSGVMFGEVRNDGGSRRSASAAAAPGRRRARRSSASSRSAGRRRTPCRAGAGYRDPWPAAASGSARSARCARGRRRGPCAWRAGSARPGGSRRVLRGLGDAKRNPLRQDVAHRRQRPEISDDRLNVVVGEDAQRRIRHDDAEPPAVVTDALADRPHELVVRPAAAPVSGSGVMFGATSRVFLLRMSPAPSLLSMGRTRSSSYSGEWHSKHSQTAWDR